GVGHGVDPAQNPAADEEAAADPQHHDDSHRPAAGYHDDVVDAFALLDVAADQEMEAAGQFGDQHQGVVLGSFRGIEPAIGGLDPAGPIEDSRLERSHVAGKALPNRSGEQIEARAGTSRADVDDGHKPPDATALVLLGEPIDFGTDGGGDLLRDQAPRIEREKA